MGMKNRQNSYIIVSSRDAIKDINSMLLTKEYKTLEIVGAYGNMDKKSLIGWNEYIENDELRKDALFFLKIFNLDYILIKYKGEDNARKLFKNGSDKILEISIDNHLNNSSNSYFYSGFIFSFNEGRRYWIPNKKEDLKTGMLLEIQKNDNWVEKIVEDIDTEWKNLYELLLKYDKLRVVSKN
jgi:hypothetical protein